MMVDIGGDDTGLRDNLSLLRPIRVNRSRFPNGAELPLTLPLTLTPTPTLTLTLGMPRTRAARAKGTTPRAWCPLSTTVTSTQRILTFTTLGR